VPTKTVLWGSVPYVMMMIVGIIIMSIFPSIATWLPDHLMGVAVGPK
jgi:TRAP-type mannitol/chloroaromatic compound transport system permease large subunit